MKNRAWTVLLLAACAVLAAAQFAEPPKPRAQAAAQVVQSEAVLRRPDLVVEKIWIVRDSPVAIARPPLPVTQLKKGTKYLLYCRYKNQGRALHGVWKLGYLVDGQMVWNQYWGDVAAGAAHSEHNPGFVPTVIGPHTYECRLDYDAEVKEVSENNNRAQISFSVAP